MSLILLNGCSDASEVCQSYIHKGEFYQSLVDVQREKLIYCDLHKIDETILYRETSRWCVLMITDGEIPIRPDMQITEIRTLNLVTDQIESRTDTLDSLDTWKYWLGCNIKYR